MSRDGKTAAHVRNALKEALATGRPQILTKGEHYTSPQLVRLHVSTQKKAHPGCTFRASDKGSSIVITALKEFGVMADFTRLCEQIKEAAIGMDRAAFLDAVNELEQLAFAPGAGIKNPPQEAEDDLV